MAILDTPPNFEQIMALADENLAHNSLIKAYVANAPEGQAFRKIKAAADAGDIEAKLMAAYMMHAVFGTTEDIEGAKLYRQEALEAGSVTALYNYGLEQLYGGAGERDIMGAYDTFQEVLEKDQARGNFAMALYSEQINDREAPYQVRPYLALAAKKGSVQAMTTLADYMIKGEYGPVQMSEAAGLYRQAYNRGDLEAGYHLSKLYRTGTGVEASQTKAEKLIENLVARGDIMAYFDTGQLYGYPHKAGYDIDKAKYYFSRSARGGLPAARYMYALSLLRGEPVAEDIEKAEYYLQLCAEAGCSSAASELGAQYASGQYFERSSEKAVEYYIMAASGGDEFAFNTLSSMFMGQGYQSAYEPFIDFLEYHGARGNLQTAQLLAELYESGSGVVRDPEKAEAIYIRLAEFRHVPAMIALGNLYRGGEIDGVNYKKSRYWFAQATKNGSGHAGFVLGQMLLKGEGGVVNEAGAYYLMHFQAKQNDFAKKELDKLAAKISTANFTLAKTNIDRCQIEKFDSCFEI